MRHFTVRFCFGRLFTFGHGGACSGRIKFHCAFCTISVQPVLDQRLIGNGKERRSVSAAAAVFKDIVNHTKFELCGIKTMRTMLQTCLTLLPEGAYPAGEWRPADFKLACSFSNSGLAGQNVLNSRQSERKGCFILNLRSLNCLSRIRGSVHDSTLNTFTARIASEK